MEKDNRVKFNKEDKKTFIDEYTKYHKRFHRLSGLNNK